jgi:hypothetical protein
MASVSSHAADSGKGISGQAREAAGTSPGVPPSAAKDGTAHGITVIDAIRTAL